MTQLTAFMTGKGGSGKSTGATNFAVYLASLNRRVLLLDFDPQSSLTGWFGLREEEDRLANPLTVLSHGNNNIDDVMSASNFDQFDEVILDSPGSDNHNYRSMLKYVDFCVMPVLSGGFDRLEVVKNIRFLDDMLDIQHAKGRDVKGVMYLNKTKPNSKKAREARKEYNELSKHMHVMDSQFGILLDFPDAVEYGLSVLEFDPTCRAAEHTREWARELIAMRDEQ